MWQCLISMGYLCNLTNGCLEVPTVCGQQNESQPHLHLQLFVVLVLGVLVRAARVDMQIQAKDILCCDIKSEPLFQ